MNDDFGKLVVAASTFVLALMAVNFLMGFAKLKGWY